MYSSRLKKSLLLILTNFLTQTIFKITVSMQQMDLFDETLQKKIIRLEKWIGRLNKEMYFLKEVYNLTQRQQKIRQLASESQVDMFSERAVSN